MLALKRNITLFLPCLFFVFFAQQQSFAQDSSSFKTPQSLEKAEVKWLGQWPDVESKNQKKEFREQVGNILFGKKKQELKRPVSLVIADDNSMWILDQESRSVFNVKEKAYSIPHFIEKKKDFFSSLVSVCKFRDGELLFTDSYSNKIFVINPAKKECSILNDSLKLDKITGIAYSPETHKIWLIETGTHQILVLNESGKILKTIGSRGAGKGEFNFPTHLWIDKQSRVFVVDAMNFRIQVLSPEGEVISAFGKSGDATGYFASPKGIATDSYGNIYVVDALFHVVQIFDIQGNFLYSFGTQGRENSEFWMPSGIYIDKDDKIYVADSYNSRIQTFQLITGGTR